MTTHHEGADSMGTTTSDETRDYRIRAGDDPREHGVYVTETTATAVRADVNGQCEQHVQAIAETWDDCNVEAIDDLQAVRSALSNAMHCIDTLIDLAPLPDDGEDE